MQREEVQARIKQLGGTSDLEKVIALAEAQIALVLQQLERKTNCVVESIGFQESAVVYDSDQALPTVRNRIVLQLRRAPGAGWGC